MPKIRGKIEYFWTTFSKGIQFSRKEIIIDFYHFLVIFQFYLNFSWPPKRVQNKLYAGLPMFSPTTVKFVTCQLNGVPIRSTKSACDFLISVPKELKKAPFLGYIFLVLCAFSTPNWDPVFTFFLLFSDFGPFLTFLARNFNRLKWGSNFQFGVNFSILDQFFNFGSIFQLKLNLAQKINRINFRAKKSELKVQTQKNDGSF